jgi:uncharacterized cofD-like protein
MSKSIKEWFSSGLKMKRWLFLVILGTVILSYGVANIIALKTLEMVDIFSIIIFFTFGFTCVVTGFIFAQRRLLQAVAESNTGLNNRNLNVKKLLFDKKMLDRNIKIVVIGGGTGLSTMLRGLKLFSNNITAIVTMADDGANSGLLRKELGILPPGDIRKCIVALSNKEHVMEELMQYRFKDGSLKGYSFGNLFLAAMNDICEGNFATAVQNTSDVLSITGKVLPVTIDNINIGAKLKDGTEVIGESHIAEKVIERKSPVEKMFMIPERCNPAPDVLRSIKEADVIIVGPGSLYTSIIPNLLIKEVADEIKKSKATKILVANIMTQPGETDNYTVSDFINAIHEHAGKGIVDYCLANDSDIMPEYIRRYNEDGADVIEIDRNNIKNTGVRLIVDDLATINSEDYIRHDPFKLAKSIMKIICDNMDLKNNKQAFEYFIIKSKIKSLNKRAKPKKESILFRDVKIVTKKSKKNNSVETEYNNIPIVGQQNETKNDKNVKTPPNNFLDV